MCEGEWLVVCFAEIVVISWRIMQNIVQNADLWTRIIIPMWEA